MPAGRLCCISITCQAWLISPAPIWSHKSIAVGYVCGTATALLNQRSHLQSSWSNKQQLVKWGHSVQEAMLWPLSHKLRGCSVLVAPTETENLQPLLALGNRRGLALPHCSSASCFFSVQHWKQDSNNCPALQDMLRSVLSTDAWQCRVPLAPPVPLHCRAAHWQGH